jgi:hypothetical protein
MAELNDMDRRVRYLEDGSEKNDADHKEFQKRFEQLGKDGVRMEERFINIMTTLNQMSCTLSELKGKDGKRWEMIVGAIIVAAVSGAVGYFLSRL